MDTVGVQDIPVDRIDPESTINVRRTGVEENVEKVKKSIEEHGYWPEMAIVVRPHPSADSQYDYEHVTGQCRFKACVQLGMSTIRGFILELSDEEAIQRSWLENEARGDLSYSDRAYWVERIYKKYAGDGHTSGEALAKAANYLGVGIPTAMRYYALVVLPDDVKQMVDQGIVSNSNAVDVVRNTYDAARPEESQDKMRDRVNWLNGLDKESREYGLDALKDLGHGASLEQLNARVDEAASKAGLVVSVSLTTQVHDDLLNWGKRRGLYEETVIVNHMISVALREQ